METIIHERQEGSLCAQHCLNALLQGSYFTAVDLASLAQQMDDEERLRMAESGVDSEDYRRFLEQPSGNYDDSGYFSVQVISSALRVWGLELIPYNSTEARVLHAQRSPAEMQAFICNYRDHWFTIRRLGNQWFNLNSLLTGPELISDTYLAMFLAQLQQEGYSIFVVFGPFPECEADNFLRLVPAVQTEKPRAIVSAGRRLGSSTSRDSEDDQELQKALRLSIGAAEDDSVFEDPELRKALSMSLNQENRSPSESELQKALAMSLNQDTSPPETELQKALGIPTSSGKTELQRTLSMPPINKGTTPRESELKKALRPTPSNVTQPETELLKALRTNLSHQEVSILTKSKSQEEEEEELKKALRLSLQSDEQEDPELEKAVKLSMECCETRPVDPEEVRRRRLTYLEERTPSNTSALPSTNKSKVNT